MRNQRIFRLLAPVSAAIAGQLARPHGWFGRAVMTRVLNRGNRELIEATLDALPLGPETRLLDVGFGGGLLLALARRRGVVALTGVDPSEAAVRSLAGRPPWGAPSATLRVEQGAVEAMPFGDGAFDAVASTNTVYFWPDAAAALRELRRVLRPGGHLVLAFSGAEKLRAFDAITRHGFRFHEADALVRHATEAGLAEVHLVALHGRNTTGDYLLVATA
jgi:arsenite methyltransferase